MAKAGTAAATVTRAAGQARSEVSAKIRSLAVGISGAGKAAGGESGGTETWNGGSSGPSHIPEVPLPPTRFGSGCAVPALFLRPFATYIGVAGSPVMEINGDRHMRFGPGRSTRRLHIATFTSFDLPAVRTICWNFRHRRPRLLTSARCRGSMDATGESGHPGCAADPQNSFERDRT